MAGAGVFSENLAFLAAAIFGAAEAKMAPQAGCQLAWQLCSSAHGCGNHAASAALRRRPVWRLAFSVSISVKLANAIFSESWRKSMAKAKWRWRSRKSACGVAAKKVFIKRSVARK
jgi:hypothetical protein